LGKEGELVRPLGHVEKDPLVGGQRRSLRKKTKNSIYKKILWHSGA